MVSEALHNIQEWNEGIVATDRLGTMHDSDWGEPSLLLYRHSDRRSYRGLGYGSGKPRPENRALGITAEGYLKRVVRRI